MNMIKMRFPIWIVAFALLFTLVFQTAGPVFATLGPPSTTDSGVEVTGYTVSKKGAIHKGDIITITLSILDTRITDDTPTPAATLNTPSFSRTTGANGTVISTPPAGQPGGPTKTDKGLTYTLKFANIRYTGTPDTFACNISYPDLPTPVAVITASLPMSQLVKYKAPDSGTSDDNNDNDFNGKPTDFVLKDARFGDGTVYAGEQFVLSAVILATNGAFPVENVSVTFSPPEQLTIADGASVVYIGTMAPNTSTSVSVALIANANVPEGSYSVAISATGMNQQTGAPAGGGQMTVSIPILQPERFEIFDAMLPTDLTAGIDDGLGFSTVTLVNKGKGTVANVTIEIVGEGLRTDIGRQYLGNVASGEQKVADFIMYADIPGVIDAKVLVLYENVRGEQISLERPFTVNVNEGWFEDPGFYPEPFPPDEPRASGPPMWLWIIIAAAAAVVVTTLLIRRRKKKKAEAEAALDDLDDDE